MANRSPRHKPNTAPLPQSGRRLLEMEVLEDRRVLSGGALLLALPVAVPPVLPALQASTQTLSEAAPIQVDYSVAATVSAPAPAAAVGETSLAVNATVVLKSSSSPATPDLPQLQATVETSLAIAPIPVELSVAATINVNTPPTSAGGDQLTVNLSLAPAAIPAPVLQVPVKTDVSMPPVQADLSITAGTDMSVRVDQGTIQGNSVIQQIGVSLSTDPPAPGAGQIVPPSVVSPLHFFGRAGETTGSDSNAPTFAPTGDPSPAASPTVTDPASPRLDGGDDSSADDELDDSFNFLYEDAAAPAPVAAVADRVFAADQQDESAVQAPPSNGQELPPDLLVSFTLAGGVGVEVMLMELLARLKRAGRVPADFSPSRALLLWLMGGGLAAAGSLHSFRRRRSGKEKRRTGVNPSSWKWLSGSTTLAPGVGS